VYHRHIHAFSCETVQKQKSTMFIKATTDAAVKNKIYNICSMLESSERNFCDGVEMKFIPPLGGIQQADAPEIAAKGVTPCFAFG